MADQTTSHGIPWGMTILLVLAAFLYAALLANLLGARGSDAAGRGMAMGFAGIIGLVLWLVLTALFAIAILKGRMPAYAAVAAMALLPLSAIASASAAGLYMEGRGNWPLAAPILLPPLLALYALWARLFGWHDALAPTPTSLVMGAAILILIVVPLAVTVREYLPDPKRDAARAAAAKAFEAAEDERRRQAEAAEVARLRSLGPESSLRDYLPYLLPGVLNFQEAVAGARLVTRRNDDAVALLKEDRLRDLAELWRLDITPAVVCGAYSDALKAEANKVSRLRSDYISAAIDLEWQLPNIKWLSGAHCDLDSALSEAEAKIRAVSDSARLTDFADELAGLRQRR